MGDLIGKSVSGNLIYIPQSEFERIINSDLKFNDKIKIFSQACRVNILYMIANAGSGHIGSSFSSIEIMTYINIKKVFSDSKSLFFSSKGHDAPALYSVLTALNKIDFKLISKLRRIDGLPGHPDINTPEIITNTGSLGMGISKAKGFIVSNRLNRVDKQVFVLLGDGELQEGQIWESIVSAVNLKMNELVIIVDHNKLQSDTLVKNVSDLGNLEKKFNSFGLNVFRCDGNDIDEFSKIIEKIDINESSAPNIIIADTIKGKGVSFMEHTSIDSDVELYKFHSGAPSADNYFKGVDELITGLNKLSSKLNFATVNFEIKTKKSKQNEIITHKLIETYSSALLEISNKNKDIVALDADLILDTGLIPFKKKFPERFIECGIAEQDMVSQAGTISLSGLLPIVHSFACFLTSRASEQIYNNCTQDSKVIYVGSLAGLLPAGPGHSHQALRDVTAMSGMPNLCIIEPSTPDQVYQALKWAVDKNKYSTYIRLTSIPIKYEFDYNSINEIQEGCGHLLFNDKNVENTIIASNPILLNQIIIALNKFGNRSTFQVIIMPWLNKIDVTWFKDKMSSKSKNVIVFENHYNTFGFGDFIISNLAKANLLLNSKCHSLGVDKMPLSGTNEEILKDFKLDSKSIYETLFKINEE